MWMAIGSSCGDTKKEFVNITIDHETTPTMETHDVETVISDSGVIRYKITAPLWLVFDEAVEPRWNFSEGLHLEKYDNDLNIDATFDCDSAKYLSQRKLWKFSSSVHALNVAKDRFDTELLFWDQQNKKVYTDSFIHIEKSDRIIEGYGFVSNETMTDYYINRVSGIFPINEMRKQNNDSTTIANTDSIAKSPETDITTPQKTTLQQPSNPKTRTINNSIQPIQVNRSKRAERLELKQISTTDGN